MSTQSDEIVRLHQYKSRNIKDYPNYGISYPDPYELYHAKQQGYNEETFLSEWSVNFDGETIVLPLRETYDDDDLVPSPFNYDFVVKWGDGLSDHITSFDDVNASHTYEKKGIYTIEIEGLMETFSMGAVTTSKNNITRVLNIGKTGLKSLSGFLYETDNLVECIAGNCDTSNVTSLKTAFANCPKIASIDFSTFDSNNLTNLEYTFAASKILKSINLSNFKTHNVTTFKGTFWETWHLDNLNISSFDFQSTTTTYAMFYKCGTYSLVADFTTLGLNWIDSDFMFSVLWKLKKFDFSNFGMVHSLTSMHSMFSFMQGIESFDLSSFDTSNIETFRDLFRNAYNAKSINTDNFDSSKVTIFKGMYDGSKSIKSIDISHYDMSEAVNIKYLFKDAVNLETAIMPTNTGKVIEMSMMLQGTTSLKDINIDELDITSLNTAHNMMEGSKGLSTSRYNSTLIKWNNQAIENDISTDFGPSNYTGATAIAAKQSLIDSGWTILDGGEI